MALKDWLGIRSSPMPSPEPKSTTSDFAPNLGTHIETNVESKSFALGLNDTLGSLLAVGSAGGVSSPTAAMWAYRECSAVANPIDLVAEDLAQLEPVLKNMETGEVTRDHELLSLLRSPHPMFSQRLLLEAVAKYYLVTAEVPIVALGNVNTAPVGLIPINPQFLNPSIDGATGIPGSWTISGKTLTGIYRTDPLDMGRAYQHSELRELRMIRGFSSRDNSLVRGESKLVAASKDFLMSMHGADYNVSLLEKGGRLTLVFQFKQSLDRDVFEERREQILAQFSGSGQAGRPIVTQGGELDIREGSSNPHDLEHGATMQRAEGMIYKRYKVPIVLANTDAATFNNMGTALEMLWDDAIIPPAKRLLGEMGEWLLPKYGEDPSKVMLTFDPDQIEPLRKRRLEELKTRSELGVEAPNEIRESMGLDPMEGGEEPLVSSALTPLSMIGDEPDPADSLLLPPGTVPDDDDDDDDE